MSVIAVIFIAPNKFTAFCAIRLLDFRPTDPQTATKHRRHKIDSPSTSRMLPIIEPVIDALTTLLRPFESAITAMISSAALPNVAFNNPPAPSPIRVANASVARPILQSSTPSRSSMAVGSKTMVRYGRPGGKRAALSPKTREKAVADQDDVGRPFGMLRE